MASRTTAIHNAWAERQWERYHDNQAQREHRQPEFIGDLIAAASVPVEYWPEELKRQVVPEPMQVIACFGCTSTRTCERVRTEDCSELWDCPDCEPNL